MRMLLVVISLLSSGGSQNGGYPQHPASQPCDVVNAPAITVFRDPGRYVSFPDVKRTARNRLLCVFRDASFPKKVQHIEPDARIVGCISDDNGLHWSSPSVIYDDPACQNDPSIAVLGDGRLLLTFFNWVGVRTASAPAEDSPFARKVNHGDWGTWAEPGGVHILWGRADPLKWDPPAAHLCGSARVLRATSSKVLQTRRGTLLLPVYGGSREKPVDQAYVLRSTDGGRTWGDEILIAADPAGRIDMHEPALVETTSDQILAVMRTANAGDHLYTTRSTDDGLTWTQPAQTELVGHPADLITLPDGRILLAYGYRHAPFGVRAGLSSDGGTTWAPPIVITASGAQTDLGYPSLCLTDDGHVLAAYYMNGPGTRDRWIECKRIPLAIFGGTSKPAPH